MRMTTHMACSEVEGPFLVGLDEARVPGNISGKDRCKPTFYASRPRGLQAEGMRRGDYEGALAEVESALVISPNLASACGALARC